MFFLKKSRLQWKNFDKYTFERNCWGWPVTFQIYIINNIYYNYHRDSLNEKKYYIRLLYVEKFIFLAEYVWWIILLTSLNQWNEIFQTLCYLEKHVCNATIYPKIIFRGEKKCVSKDYLNSWFLNICLYWERYKKINIIFL